MNVPLWIRQRSAKVTELGDEIHGDGIDSKIGINDKKVECNTAGNIHLNITGKH